MSNEQLELDRSFLQASLGPLSRLFADRFLRGFGITRSGRDGSLSVISAPLGVGLLPLAHRIRYVYLHIDRESLTNEQGNGSHPSKLGGQRTTSICHPGRRFLESGALDGRGSGCPRE